MRPGSHPLLWWALALCLAGLIFWLSSSPDARGVAGWIELTHPRDKIVHGMVFGVLAGFVYLATGKPVLAVLLASGYGALDELHQATVPGRIADAWDWLADTTGAILMVLVLWALWGRREAGDGRIKRGRIER